MYDHLDAFLKNTPLSNRKLLSAWDGLSDESIIYILSCRFNKIDKELSENKISEEIVTRGLEHKNPYIRYLSAEQLKSVSWYNESHEKSIYKKIKNDPDELVRATLVEYNQFNIDMGCEFINLNQIERLLLLSERKISLSNFLNILEEIVKNHKEHQEAITDEELLEVVEEFIKSPAIQEYVNAEYIDIDDGFSWYLYDEEPNRLWKVISKLPVKSAYTLVQKIPLPNRAAIDENYIKSLNIDVLNALLKRKDSLSYIRKKVLISDEYPEDLKYSAAEWISLTDEEFADFTSIEKLTLLSKSRKLTLTQSYYIRKCLSQKSEHYDDFINKITLNRNEGERIANLQLEVLSYETMDLNLLLFTQILIAKNNSFKELEYYDENELTGNQKCIIERLIDKEVNKEDLWASFINIKKFFESNNDVFRNLFVNGGLYLNKFPRVIFLNDMLKKYSSEYVLFDKINSRIDSIKKNRVTQPMQLSLHINRKINHFFEKYKELRKKVNERYKKLDEGLGSIASIRYWVYTSTFFSLLMLSVIALKTKSLTSWGFLALLSIFLWILYAENKKTHLSKVTQKFNAEWAKNKEMQQKRKEIEENELFEEDGYRDNDLDYENIIEDKW